MAESRTRKQKEVPSWVGEEAAALSKLFAEKSKLSQAEFGARYEIGSQGMVWQYLNGHRPLNISAATAFATGLGVTIPAFSPRLAAEIERAYAKVRGSTDHGLSEAALKVIDAVRKADNAGEPETTFKMILRMLPEEGEPVARMNP
ncbi:putative phage repressor [Pandoraea morbifera]|uniref:Putative phage repressor n=1 Tax=Pandoraea morbifera TaxID=2508300 RepID=A0A5E4YSU6_9BURK|nr:putative phage repressor [Pandoraea morbifera]